MLKRHTLQNLPVGSSIYGHTTMAFGLLGKPTNNAYIETFNEPLRDECLNLHWSVSVPEARRLIEAKTQFAVIFDERFVIR